MKVFTKVASWTSVVLFAVAFMVGGYVFAYKWQPGPLITYIGAGVIFVCFVLNNVGTGLVVRRMRKLTPENATKMLAEGKQTAATDEKKLVANVRKWRVLVVLWVVFLPLLFIAYAFVCGTNSHTMPFVILSVLGLASVAPIYVSGADSDYFDEKYLLPRDEFPTLYFLAARAAKAVGLRKKVGVTLIAGGDASVGNYDNMCVVVLGSTLVATLDEGELYAVLLHEMSHLTQETNLTEVEGRLDSKLRVDINGFEYFLRVATSGWILAKYQINYALYSFYAAERIELRADEATVAFGNVDKASSALVKVAMIGIFDYTYKTFDEPNFYREESIYPHIATNHCKQFLHTVSKNADKWLEILQNEIVARSASHPVCRDRIAAIGGTLDKPTFDADIGKEAAAALAYCDKEIVDNNKDDYDKQREEYFLEPQRLVDEWRQNGCPDMKERTRELIVALTRIDCTDDALALCDKVIYGGSSEFALAQAYFTKGLYLLHDKLDKSGLDMLYKAMEINNNYRESCMEEIGVFCCLMGLADELDDYREFAVKQFYVQQKESNFSRLGANDDLSEEHLPEELLADIVNFIVGAGDGTVKRIYLVHKRIDDDVCCSPFVIEFDKGTTADKKLETMNKVFEYLDTRPDDTQYALFNYTESAASAVRKVKNSCVYDKYDGINDDENGKN